MSSWIGSAAMVVAAVGGMNGTVEPAKPMIAKVEMSDASSLFKAFGGDVRAVLACARSTNRSIVVAHRGGFAAGYPENALATFERMAASAPVMFETDVVSSRDGVDFMMHDARVDRTTSGKGRADELDWSELSKLALTDEIGMETRWHPTRFPEFLARMRGKAFLMLDLKAPRSTADIVRQVFEAGMLPGTIFIAYNPAQVREILAAAPKALVALGAETPEQVATISANFPNDGPFVMLAGRLANQPAFYGSLTKAGHFVLAGSYLGDDPADARNQLGQVVPEFDNAGANGVQMIVSNDPTRAVEYLLQAGRYVDPIKCPGSPRSASDLR